MLPYLVLLRVGFTLPRLLPAARCALTAPFHPYLCEHRRYIFCGTFRRLTPPRRYLAPCPVEPGLSSMTKVTAAVRPASSSIVRHGRNGSRLRSGVEFSDNCEQKTKPLYLIIFIDIYYYSTPPLRGERCRTGLQATYKRKSI